jgi:NAD(P)H-dependent FMN reductase
LLTALIAPKDQGRFSRVAARWLLKYLEAVDDATIYDASFITANLQALGGRNHANAVAALRDLAESP